VDLARTCRGNVRLGAVLCVVLCIGANGANGAAIQCEKQPGFMQGPVVPDARTAKEIYIAVARAPELHRLEGHGPITVLDEGDKWGVTHYLEPKRTFSHHGKLETVTVVAGGGDLAMDIDKCTGAVSMMLNR